MASPSKPELLRLSSIPLSPLEYFTDSSNVINAKADLVLVVDKQKYYCHRLLLSLVSPVFSRMFDGQFKEHNEQEIILEGKSSESILELLKYIYPQFSGQITNDNVEDFLHLADEYMIDHLKQPCKDLLLKQLNLYKYVSLRVQQKLEQTPATKPKSLHASDSALNSARSNEDHRAGNSPRRLTSKPVSSYLKVPDKTGSTSNTYPRYVLVLDRTQMPTFHDTQGKTVVFNDKDVEIWLRRLRILYQIDKGRNYGEVIDGIVSILQFIPAALLLPLAKITNETFTVDEMMLNDIARARMYLLEEWAADGNPYRPITLTENYRTMSPSALLTTQLIPMVKEKLADDQENLTLSTVSTISDNDESMGTIDLVITTD